MASRLGLEEEEREEVNEGAENPADEFVHPWAQEMIRRGLSFNGSERNRLFIGLGGARFADVSALSGSDTPLDGRATLAGDFDLDGDVDLFVHSLQRGRHALFRNDLDPEAGAWLALRLSGTGEGIGATVIVEHGQRTQAQVLTRGAGFASCQPPELLFAAGEGARVSVRWPYGELEDFGSVAGGRYILEAGSGKARALGIEPAPLADPLPAGLELAPGELVPVLTLLDGEGQRVVVDPAQAGQRTWIAFWASYCAPCVEEIPVLERLHGEPGARVIAISVDAAPQRARARDLLDQAGATYPGYGLSLQDEDSEALDQVIDLLRLPIPTILELNEEGRLVRVLHRIDEER